MTSTPRTGTGRVRLSLAGAAAGPVAAAAGLAVAELVAATATAWQSPVLDVGDRVVDGVPRDVKDLAIRWFGTNDKVALLVGIAILLAVGAAALGVLAFVGRRRASLIGIALFAAVGATASQTTRRSAPWHAVAPSLVGAAITGIALWWLWSLRCPPAVDTAARETVVDVDAARAVVGEGAGDIAVGEAGADAPGAVVGEGAVDRRRFVAATAALGAGAIALGTTGRRLSGRRSVAGQRAGLALRLADRPTPPAGAGVQAPGAVPFFTPNSDFYRIDTALTAPQVSIDGWSLRITGLVDRELELTFDELIDRELVEADITMTCVSNEVGGSLVGNARWLGVRLDELLAEAGIRDGADQIVGRSVDGWTSGFPTAALDGRDALVAIGMNGEPLPVEHGYPARLVVPGLYGYVSATKWLTELELTRFDRFDAYWADRGWSQDGPIRLQSRIDAPRGLATVRRGPVPVAGVAWAQTRGIERVEIQVDDGDWLATTLADELNVDTWRQWSTVWDAAPGRHTLRVRAVERGPNGAIQTADRSEPFPSGATGQHQIVVLVSDR